MRQLAFAAALAMSAAPAFAQTVYADGNFSGWGFERIQIPNPTGGSETGVRVATGGVPGAMRRHTVTIDRDTGDFGAAVSRFGTTTATRYMPIEQGAIVAVDCSFDVRSGGPQPETARFGIGLKQAQVVYIARAEAPPAGDQWQKRAHVALTQNDFVRADGIPISPDFSTNGAPIRFCLVSGATSLGAPATSIVEFDNFFVKVWRRCPADLDNGSGTGAGDNAVNIDDLLYFLHAFEAGAVEADLDDGSGTGAKDQGVDIADLVFMLVRFEAGC